MAEHVSYPSEWLDNVVSEVKLIIAELAKDTFNRYRQCGEAILRSGYRKGQWNSEHKKYFLEKLGISHATFSHMVQLGEMSEEEFATVGRKFQSFHAWENRGVVERKPCSRCGVYTAKGDYVDEKSQVIWVCDVCLSKENDEWDDMPNKKPKWFKQPRTQSKVEIDFLNADRQQHRADYVSPVSKMDEALLSLSERYLSPIGVKIEFQPDIILVQAKPDLLYTLADSKKVAVFADGPIHLKPHIEARDDFVRGWLRRRGIHVLPCAYKSFSEGLAWEAFTRICDCLSSEFGLKIDLNMKAEAK